MILDISKKGLDRIINRALIPVTVKWNSFFGLSNLWLARLTISIGCLLIIKADIVDIAHAKGRPILLPCLCIFYFLLWVGRLRELDKLEGFLERLEDIKENIDLTMEEYIVFRNIVSRRLFWTLLGAFAVIVDSTVGLISGVSFGLLFIGLSQYFTLHFTPGGGGLVRKAFNKVKELLTPLPGLIPSPIRG